MGPEESLEVILLTERVKVFFSKGEKKKKRNVLRFLSCRVRMTRTKLKAEIIFTPCNFRHPLGGVECTLQ